MTVELTVGSTIYHKDKDLNRRKYDDRRRIIYREHFRPVTITGGESGPGARPFDVTWAYDIVGQCKATETAVFVKQFGADPKSLPAEIEKLRDRKGGDWNEWPEALRVREMPNGRL